MVSEIRLTADTARWTSVPGPKTIVRQELPNGIVCLVYENFSSPSVVVQGRLPVGGLAVPRAKAGLTGFVADMLMRGTAHRTFAAINESIESVGASLEFDTSWHSTTFSGHSLAEDMPLICDIVADCLRYPTFPAEHVAKVRGEIITSLEQRAHDTRRMAMLTLYETLFEGHPMSISGLGYQDTIEGITVDDLRAFYEAHFRPQGLTITIVGAVAAGQALDTVRRALGDWQPPTPAPKPAFPPMPALTEVRRREVAIPGKTQADLVLGWIGPERQHPDYMAARLANTVLGVFGMMGRIGDSVRDRQGLAYYAYSSLISGLTPGPWMAVAGVDPGHVEQAAASILEEVRRMREELVPEQELAENKAYLTGSMPLALETNAGVASTLETMEVYQLGLDYLERYPILINEVTAQDIQRLSAAYLDPRAYALSIARPEAKA